MDISIIKNTLIKKKLTYQNLADMSGVPLQTIQKVLAGVTQNPRIDTIQAIEKALGLDNDSSNNMSEEEKELIALLNQLTDEETKELSNYVDYIISKRK